MIHAGDDNLFAISAEIIEIRDACMFGSFRFVLHGKVCGNWNDWAHLESCYSWLREFHTKPMPRYEPELLSLPADEVFDRLVRPVLVSPRDTSAPSVPKYYPDTYERFHISHLGMSSFDSVTVLLIEGPELQRCVWQSVDDSAAHSETFPPHHMQNVARDFCALFEAEASARGFALWMPSKVNPTRQSSPA